jgi:hypothetical protein
MLVLGRRILREETTARFNKRIFSTSELYFLIIVLLLTLISSNLITSVLLKL